MNNENWVDLSNVPKTGKGYMWSRCNHTPVDFCYNGNHGTLYVERPSDKGMGYYVVSYDGKEYDYKYDLIAKCMLGKLFGFATAGAYKYNVGEILHTKSSDLLVKDQIKMNERNRRGYTLECQTCHHVFNNTEGNLVYRGDGCPVCTNHVVKVGVNDLWTTRPDVARCLADKSLGYKLSQFSNKKIEFICPDCGKSVGKKEVYNVTTHGVMCHKCSDGISYPNKFMSNILDELNVPYEHEVVFPWCKFPKYGKPDVETIGKYDFVLHHAKVIIEMDGGIGHGRAMYTNSDVTLEETVYRDEMKDKLARENGYTLIRIDCGYTNEDKFEYSKNAILNSPLTKYIDLSNLDWKLVDINSQKSKLIEACNLYNSNMPVAKIAVTIKVDLSTAYDYVHKGTDLGLCNFSSKLKIKEM